MYVENEPAMKCNAAVLNDLPGGLYIIEALDEISDICKYPMIAIQDAQNQKQTNTGDIAKLLKLNVGVKVMLAVNIDRRGRLINYQTVNMHIEFSQDSVCKVYVKFSDEQVGLKTMRSSYLGKKSSWVSIENVKLRF